MSGAASARSEAPPDGSGRAGGVGSAGSSRGSPALVAAGAATLLLVWGGPLPGLAREAFVAHMAMHMGVVAVAAPLLALGLAGGRWDPVPRWPRAFAAVPASLVELAIVWTWHAPALHHLARHEAPFMALEQGGFLLSGLLVWLSAFGGSRGGTEASRGRTAAGMGALLLTSMHMTLLGALLALSPRPLYAHSSGSPFGLGALEDQHLGGTLMLTVGGAVYLLGGLTLARRLVAGAPEGRP